MDVLKAIMERRTIRRFKEKEVPFEVLEKCVDAARVSPSARNVQELEFVIVDDKEKVAEVNGAVRFGGTVAEKGRVRGEGPKAFIAIVAEKERANEDYTGINVGIAAGAIVLAAWEQGIGCCIMGAIEREQIKKILGIPETYSLPLVVSMGYPLEKPVMEEVKGKKLGYWLEGEELHIPKRELGEVLHRNQFGLET